MSKSKIYLISLKKRLSSAIKKDLIDKDELFFIKQLIKLEENRLKDLT